MILDSISTSDQLLPPTKQSKLSVAVRLILYISKLSSTCHRLSKENDGMLMSFDCRCVYMLVPVIEECNRLR